MNHDFDGQTDLRQPPEMGCDSGSLRVLCQQGLRSLLQAPGGEDWHSLQQDYLGHSPSMTLSIRLFILATVWQCPLPLREESAERCQYYGEELVGFGSNHPNLGFIMEQNWFNR